MNSKEVILKVAEVCDEKKAENIVALDMNQVSLVADYFLICHGTNERQVQAVARSVKESLERKEMIIEQMEGYEKARWIVIDAGDIVCHIFHKDERSYYNLERL